MCKRLWVLHCGLEGGSICAKYQIFERRQSCTYWSLCARHVVRAYALRACARTVRINCSQLYFTDCTLAGPYVIPMIVTCSWKPIPSSVGGCIYPYCKGFRFLGIEYGSSGLFITMYSIANDDKVFKTGYKESYIISISDYGTLRLCRPSCMPGRVSSKVRSSECRHTAYKNILRGQPCLTALRMGRGTANVPLNCAEAVVFSYRACSRSMNQVLVPYRCKIWKS
jgi:hypothetical protein